MSLGSVWQSVERHQTSSPLLMVNDLRARADVEGAVGRPLLVSRIESCGFCPDPYVSASASGSTDDVARDARRRRRRRLAVGASRRRWGLGGIRRRRRRHPP